MAKIGSINIGMAVDTASLARDLAKSRAQLDGFVGKVGSLKPAIGGLGPVIGAAGAALAGLGVTAGIGKAVTAASSLNSSLAKTETIFGPAGEAIASEADRMADTLGVVKSDYIDAAAGFGAVFKGLGSGPDEAAAMGNQLAKLGIDMARFDDTADQVGFDAISSALRGEFDPIEKFRVFLTADKVAAEALAMGLATTKGEITETAKKQAIMNLIMKQSADAQGAAAREAGEVGSQLTALGGRLTNLSADFGTAIEPLTSTILGLGGDAVAGLGRFFDDNKATITEWATSAATGIGDFASSAKVGFVAIGERLAEFPAMLEGAFGQGTVAEITKGIGSAIELIGISFRNLPDFLDIAALQITEKIINIGEYLATIPANAALIGDYLANNWRELITDAIGAVGTAFSNLAGNLSGLGSAIVAFLSDPTQGFDFRWTPLLDGFEATAAKLPEMIKPHLTDMQGEIDAKLAVIGDREAARLQIKPELDLSGVLEASKKRKEAEAALAASAAGAVAAPGAEAAKGAAGSDGPKLAGAALKGSSEAYETLVNWRASMGAGALAGPGIVPPSVALARPPAPFELGSKAIARPEVPEASRRSGGDWGGSKGGNSAEKEAVKLLKGILSLMTRAEGKPREKIVEMKI